MTRLHKNSLLEALMFLIVACGSATGTPSAPLVESDSVTALSTAMKYFNSAEYKKALVFFDSLVASDSTAELHYYRGVCLYQLGDYNEGLESLAAVDSADSLFPLACFYRAEIMIAIHNTAEAVSLLRVAVARDSTYNPARVELVNALCTEGKYRDAEEFVREHFDVREVLALCDGLIAARKYDEAYPFIAKLLAADSTNSAAHLMLAEVYYNTDKFSDASEQYSFVLDTFGATPYIIKRLALCHGRMEGKANLETAISLMKRYLAISGDTTSDDIGNIGLWHYNLGDYGKAESYFRHAVKLDTLDPQARLNLGLALMQLGRPNEAITSMKIAYSLSKSTLTFGLSILKSIAAVQIRVKNYRGAIANYRRVYELDPEDGEALYGLGLAYDQSHHTRDAMYWYRRFLKNDKTTDKSFAEYAKRRLNELLNKGKKTSS